jgi:hypothetical protein
VTSNINAEKYLRRVFMKQDRFTESRRTSGDQFSRRTFIRNTSIMAAGTIAGALAKKAPAISVDEVERMVKNGRIKQSVSRWCYSKIPLDDFCVAIKKMGLTAIDLLDRVTFQPSKSTVWFVP